MGHLHRDVAQILTGSPDGAGTDAVSSVLDLTFSPDGKLVAGAGVDGIVRVWSADDGADVSTFETANRYTAHLAFSADSTRLAVTGNRDPLQIHDVATGEPIGSLPGAVSSAYAAAWSHDGARLAGAGRLTAPTVWDAASLEEVARGTGSQVKFIAFSPDDESVAFTSLKDKTVRIWSFDDDTMTELVGHTDSPTALVFSPDGRTLFTSASQEGVWAWDTATGKVRHTFD